MPVLIAVPLVELLLLFVGIGMAMLSRQTSGGWTDWLARNLRNTAIPGVGFTIDQVVKLDRYLSSRLGKATQAVSRRGVAWVSAMADYVHVTGYWSLYWPVGLLHAVQHLVEDVIPHRVKASTAPLYRRMDAVEARAKANAGAAHSVTKIVKGHDRVKEVTTIQRVAMPHAKEWEWVHDHFDALQRSVTATTAATAGVALPHAHSLPNPYGITAKQFRRLARRVEYVIGATGAAVIVARAIGGIKPNCVKKGPLGKVARRLCGMSPRALDDLLGLLADVLILTNICTVFTQLNRGLGLVQPEITAFITGVEAWACYGDKQEPPSIGDVSLSLPSSSGFALNL